MRLLLPAVQLQSAKSTAINIKMKAIMGKEDPEIDSLSRSFWRQSSFPWRQVLEFREHGTPPRPIDLWTTLQLLYVQFDSPSPLAGRPTATQVAKIEQLERESRRIEGLFTVRSAGPDPLGAGNMPLRAGRRSKCARKRACRRACSTAGFRRQTRTRRSLFCRRRWS